MQRRRNSRRTRYFLDPLFWFMGGCFIHLFVVMKIIPIPVKGKKTMGKKRQKADSSVPTSTTSNTLASDGGETCTAQVSLGNSGGLAVHRGSSRASCPYSVRQVLSVLLVYLQALSKPMISDHVALICDHSY